MNKGFSLIEIVVYISLLSILMTGIFSFTLSSIYIKIKKPSFTELDYQELNQNYHE
jgi:prepilin-type N-terminal cleavage/methylation domain-containing protein